MAASITTTPPSPLGLSYSGHVIPALCALRWLPIRERIRFKLALLMYKACTSHLPSYLFLWSRAPCSSVNSRSSFRSASDGKYVVLGTRLVFGRLSFTVASSSIWNFISPQARNFHTLGSHSDNPSHQGQIKTSGNPMPNV